jgi:protein-tyrosine phosphatase
MTEPEPPPAVLVVCTGNICRSPAAERLLAARLAPEVKVASAGTNAVVGHPMTSEIAALVERAGASSDGFAAQPLTADAITRADLVVTMTREHRGAVAKLVPRAMRRSFTLLELVRLIDHLPDGSTDDLTQRIRATVAMAASARIPNPNGPDRDDIDDPYGRSSDVYARVFAQIERAVDTVAEAIHGPATVAQAPARRA